MAAKKVKKHPGGRPSKYDPKMLPKIKKLVLLGATNDQIADFLEVDRSNFYKWLQRFKELRDVINKGKLEADAAVADSLYQRALGYKHKAVKIIYDPIKARPTYSEAFDDEGNIVKTQDPIDPNAGVIKVEYTEHYPPDTAAAKFWLEQRQAQLFGQAAKLQLQGPDGGPIQTQPVDALTFDQLMALKYGPGKIDTNAEEA